MGRKMGLDEMKHQVLLWRMVGKIRATTKVMHSFLKGSNGGNIAIILTPISRDADAWLGDMETYRDVAEGGLPDICKYEFSFKIDPHDKYRITQVINASPCLIVSLDDQEFLRIGVCVSGGSLNDNAACSMAGLLEAQEYFSGYAGAVGFSPRYEYTEAQK